MAPTASSAPTSTAVAETSVAPLSPGSPATAAPPTSTPATPGPTPTARPTASPSARPTSDRYALLTRCPSTPNCWIYVVRQGDNLFSIARYFGVPLSVVEERNPWTKTAGLQAGQKLLLPPPTK